ncbi:MAG TPA: alpha/beta hydrolase [Acidimicrobiales bacterium]|nr:alpha/beta hydrolase [Acidimicrobiales bacterium]
MDLRRISLGSGPTLEVLEAVGGDRRLLLVHGFTGAKEDFADHLDELAGLGWHVVAPDLRGHGASDAPIGADSYSLKTFAGDVLALADAMGWSRFTLLGHSMGGMVAQVAALEAPDRLEGLVLMDTSHGPIGGIDLDAIALGKVVVADGGMAALVEGQRHVEGALTTEADKRVTATRPGYREFGESKSVAAAPDMWLGMIDEVVTTQSDRLADLASSLADVPVLVIVGEQDTPFVPHAHRMAEAIPGARLEVVPDAGHSPQFENPDAYAAALRDFLAEVVG